MVISQKLSNSIFVGSFVCTLLVVAIHYNTKIHIPLDSIGGANYYFQEFLTNGIARIAVPYFALVSGFLFFLKLGDLASFSISLNKRVTTLFIPYILSSLLLLILEYWYQIIFSFNSLPPESLLNLRTWLLKPVSVQHWFLRDLMVLSLFAPVIYYFLKYARVFFIFSLVLLWLLDYEFLPKIANRYLISIETLTFFSCGAMFSFYIKQVEVHLKKIENKYLIFISAIYLILLVFRIYLDPEFMNYYRDSYVLSTLLIQNVAKLIGIYLTVLLFYKYHPTILIKLSSFSFFIYLFHGVPINRLVNKFSDFFINDEYKFYTNLPLSVLITLFMAVVLKTISPWSYNLITGGRGLKKYD